MNKFESCHGCPVREVGCHGSCDKYKAYNDEHIEARQAAHYDNAAVVGDVEFKNRVEREQERKTRMNARRSRA